jgi:hypothetical protein
MSKEQWARRAIRERSTGNGELEIGALLENRAYCFLALITDNKPTQNVIYNRNLCEIGLERNVT